MIDKAPWQQTQDEYLHSQLTETALRKTKRCVGNLTLRQWKQHEHWQAVAAAVYDGLPVPAEVLAEHERGRV